MANFHVVFGRVVFVKGFRYGFEKLFVFTGVQTGHIVGIDVRRPLQIDLSQVLVFFGQLIVVRTIAALALAVLHVA